MNQPFFITGLPRSRTAWLAAFMSGGRATCYHDLIGCVGSVSELVTRLKSDLTHGPVGDSDSGLVMAFEILNQEFPQAPWVVVDRDFDEAWASLCAFVSRGRFPIACDSRLRSRMQADWVTAWHKFGQCKRLIVVHFQDLVDTPKLRQIWRHCLPGEPFNERRAEVFQDLRVETMKEPEIKPQLARELWPSGQL